MSSPAAAGVAAQGPAPRRFNAGRGYAVAVAATGATLILRHALDDTLGGQPALVLFTLPIMLSAYVGGLGAGLMATALSYLAATYHLLPPFHSFQVASLPERIQQAAVVLAGVCISVLSEAMHRARRRADGATRDYRKAEERALRLVGELDTERTRLLAAQTVAKVGSWENDLASGELTWSPETYRIFGQGPEFKATHDAFLACVHPEDRAAVDAAFLGSIGRPGEHSFEHRLLLADGGIKFVQERWQWIFDDRGHALRAIGTCQDITARKQAAKALDELSRRTAQRERMLTTTLSNLHDFAYTFDRSGRFRFVNQPLLDLWGVTLEDVVGKDFFDLGYPPDLAERLQREVQEVFETGRRVTGEHPYTSPTGVGCVYEYILSPATGADGAVESVVGATRDITESKRAAEALRASMEEFRALAEAMPQMVWITRADGWNVYFNQQWMDYTGLTLEESLGHGWNKPFHPDDQQNAWDAWQEATAKGGIYSLECRLRRRDGAYRWWLIRGVPIKDALGGVSKWFGTCTDIHELKVAEQEHQDAEHRLLKRSEEYRLLFDGNPHPMWVFDAESLEFLAVNDAAVRLYGFSRDEFLGMTVKEIRPREEVPALLEYLATIPDTPGLVATQTRHQRKDGSLLEVEGASNPIEFQGRRARLVMAQDATQKKQLEAQLRQAMKMDAVGRLAGGVAHDFNNSLGVILGYAELLIRDESGPRKGKLEQILKATQRASSLTRQLLAFSRKEVVSPRVLDLNALLGDLEEMLARLIGEHIDLVILPGPDLGHVMADAGQLQQVVINLCVNARDAMMAGGTLRLETSNADLGAGPPWAQEPIAAGRYVRLAITDAGVGIAKELHSKVFEPFFTTKELGEGTGLGLAMVYGIVKQAGGHVSVDSDVGRGTTFTIYLPRTDEPLALAETAEPTSAEGWETILLTEDEAALRAIAREILEEHGYRVLEAEGPSQAIAMVRDQREPIHLLLTDVVMPGMNGRALADALLAMRPGLKVLYMSGYTDDILAHSGVLAPGTLLLQKPFTTSALLGRVRGALDQGHVGTP